MNPRGDTPSWLKLAQQSSGQPDEIASLASQLAKQWLEQAMDARQPHEIHHDQRMSRLLNDRLGLAFTLALTDRVFRPNYSRHSARQLRQLIAEFGIPNYLDMTEKLALQMASISSLFMPHFCMKKIQREIRQQSRRVMLNQHDQQKHLPQLKADGFESQINLLGEAVLGQKSANRRLEQLIERIRKPDTTAVSVKISAIDSQLTPLAHEECVSRVAEKLQRLYHTSLENPANPLVTLDMEDYREFQLTLDVFQQMLADKQLDQVNAGIVLQAYLPDSHAALEKIHHWALQRTQRGGKNITLRIVKGANLAMEKIHAASHNHALACFSSKCEVDASYKLLITRCCQLDADSWTTIAAASHNLLDLAYAVLIHSYYQCTHALQIEMLQGMAMPQARTLQKGGQPLRLYTPIMVANSSFTDALAYLMRRLDENSSHGNFLRDQFEISNQPEIWHRQLDAFHQSINMMDKLDTSSRRAKNRPAKPTDKGPFTNVPDSDWTQLTQRKLIESAVESFQPEQVIPLQIDGRFLTPQSPKAAYSPANTSQAFYHFHCAGKAQINQAYQCAHDNQTYWNQLGAATRREMLIRASRELAEQRSQLTAALVHDAGKTISETDSEISEAIDFAHYYAKSLDNSSFFDGSSCTPRGVITVISPWNFPIAIACGGISASLMAGNTVILKPSSKTVLCAWLLAQAFWRAGIPKKVLQFMPASRIHGRQISRHPLNNGVILTGSANTAEQILITNPEQFLIAETSGKNAIVISANCDRDLAIKDLLTSAFSHAGQKCSAASLAIIDAQLYDDESFLQTLKDAARSLNIGPSYQASSKIPPLIGHANTRLHKAATQLEDGEKWLLEPHLTSGPSHYCTPGIKLGVSAQSWLRKTECFGPILGIMRANDLHHAIQLQNDSNFGLTGGLHSLCDREKDTWQRAVEVGNAYINKATTGAIVQRQPFGGWKRSSYGPGRKAGGPNYLIPLMHWHDDGPPKMQSPPKSSCLVRKLSDFCHRPAEIKQAAASYAYWWDQEFSKAHDFAPVLGEKNCFRYRARHHILVRTHKMTRLQISLILLAARTCNTQVDISCCTEETANFLSQLCYHVQIESDKQLQQRLSKIHPHYSLRILNGSPQIYQTCTHNKLFINDAAPVKNGRIELLHYLHEQTLSMCTHRYGHIEQSANEILNELQNDE